MEQIPVFVQSEYNTKDSIRYLINQNISMMELLRSLSQLFSEEVYSIYCNGIKISDVSDIQRDSIIIASHGFCNCCTHQSKKLEIQKLKKVVENFQKIEIFFYGKPNSGKSSLIRRIVSDKFQKELLKNYYTEYNKYLKYNNQQWNLKFHDVSGWACSQYYHQKKINKDQIIIYCISVDQELNQILKNINQFKDNNAQKIIVITKIDLLKENQNQQNLTLAQIQFLEQQCSKKGWILIQTSAKKNINIEKLIKILIDFPIQNVEVQKLSIYQKQIEQTKQRQQQNNFINICLSKFPSLF